MLELKNEKIAIPVVLFAGILWSFGPLVVRYMDQPELVPWQYIFGRGLTIFIATIGIIIMAVGNTEKNSLIGFLFGITSSIGFSVFSVTLRWRKETPKFTTVAVAGLFCFVFATLMILVTKQSFFSTSYNSSMFSLHGTLVCLGLILYSIGSKAIPAAELTLLSLTEVVGGIFWVWLPLFGINEIPSTYTIVGGFFLFISLIYYSLIMRWNKRYIALN